MEFIIQLIVQRFLVLFISHISGGIASNNGEMPKRGFEACTEYSWTERFPCDEGSCKLLSDSKRYSLCAVCLVATPKELVLSNTCLATPAPSDFL